MAKSRESFKKRQKELKSHLKNVRKN